MTAEEIEIIQALGKCRLLPGSWSKRFIETLENLINIKPNQPLTASQTEWTYRLLYKFRKQCLSTYVKYQSHPHCKKALR
jgi:hypothetical protein